MLIFREYRRKIDEIFSEENVHQFSERVIKVHLHEKMYFQWKLYADRLPLMNLICEWKFCSANIVKLGSNRMAIHQYLVVVHLKILSTYLCLHCYFTNMQLSLSLLSMGLKVGHSNRDFYRNHEMKSSKITFLNRQRKKTNFG